MGPNKGSEEATKPPQKPSEQGGSWISVKKMLEAQTFFGAKHTN